MEIEKALKKIILSTKIMNEKLNKNFGFVVSETHWDREWYLTFQEFRKWLVKLIDRLINETDSHPNFRGFMLDGQTLVLEDYLEIRPYNEEKLRKLILKDKIQIGPWYVLADEFLESGEGIIRNLLLGHKIGKRFGKVMKVGYVPDTFGHIAQLPQILNGFDIHYGYGFRGYPPLFGNHEEYKGKNENTPLEHYWESPNHDIRVLFLHHITGYGNASNACVSPVIEPDGRKIYLTGITKIGNAFNQLKPRQKSKLFLFMNGSDHLEPEFEITELIDFINNEEDIQEETPITLKHATLEEYFNDMKKLNLDLPVLTGEWRGSMYTQVTPGCISTRMYLKIQNFICQRELEKYAEPFSVMALLYGGNYDSDLIWESWKWTIKNHPHDSICGCSLDRVHDDMETRFKWSLDISADMALNAMGEITSGIDEKNLIEKIKKKYGNQFNSYDVITVFNPLMLPNEDKSLVQIAEGLIQVNPNYVYRLFDYNADEINDFVFQPILDYRKLEGAQYLYKRFHGNYGCGSIILPLKELPQFGYSTFILVGCASRQVQKISNVCNVKKERNPINEIFLGKNIEIRFNSNGSFNLLDLETNMEYKNLNLFEDGADDGDEYDYAPLRNEKVLINNLNSADIQVIEENSVRSVVEVNQEFMVPEELIEIDPSTRIRSNKLIGLKIKSVIKIYKESRIVEIKTSFDNIAKSHRLRAIFPTGINSDYSYADDHFTLMKRTVKLPKDDGWFQDMQGIYHQDTFVDINDGQKGLAVLNRGLPEFEIVNYNEKGYTELKGNTIAITLVRGVEWLSQRGHLGRKSGLNGPNLPTPGAQCLRHFDVEYAIYPHSGDTIKGDCYKQAYNFYAPPKIFDKKQTQNLRIRILKDLPLNKSYFKINNPNIILTSLKKAESDLASHNGIILRFFNPSNVLQKCVLETTLEFRSIYQCNMLEQVIKQFEGSKDNNNPESNRITIEVKPSEIFTLLLETN